MARRTTNASLRFWVLAALFAFTGSALVVVAPKTVSAAADAKKGKKKGPSIVLPAKKGPAQKSSKSAPIAPRNTPEKVDVPGITGGGGGGGGKGRAKPNPLGQRG